MHSFFVAMLKISQCSWFPVEFATWNKKVNNNIIYTIPWFIWINILIFAVSVSITEYININIPRWTCWYLNIICVCEREREELCQTINHNWCGLKQLFLSLACCFMLFFWWLNLYLLFCNNCQAMVFCICHCPSMPL